MRWLACRICGASGRLVTVTGQTGIIDDEDTHIVAFLMTSTATPDHGGYENAMLATELFLTCGSINAISESFIIVATIQRKLTGTIKVHWIRTRTS